MAGELKRCCVSGEAGSRMRPKSRVLWLLSAMWSLPVMRFHVWLGSVKRAHHCRSQRVKKLSTNSFNSLSSLAIGKDVFRVFLDRLSLTRSLIVLLNASVGRSNLTGGSARDVFEVLVACSRALELSPNSILFKG